MKEKVRTLAVVQARMGSRRLPGKVLMNLGGKPLLWHIVNRLKYSKLVDKIVVATSTNKENVAISNFCQQYNISIYQGSESDLVDRFYQVAKIFNADNILRITADCPLVDPKLVDELIDFFSQNRSNYDYVSNSRPEPTYPHGVDAEVFSFSLLEELWKKIKDPFRREWFTTVIFEHPKQYRIFCLKNTKDLSNIRLTVDYPEDLELVRQIYRNLYSDNSCFYLSDILSFLNSNREVLEINKKYRRDEQYAEELAKRGLR